MVFLKKNNFWSKESDFFLWVLFFLYTCFVAISIQFIILPWLVPNLHGGNGLLQYTDSITYHQTAQARAYIINKEGWQNWLLSPLGQTPAGIASIFYAIFVPKPWVMIPIYAALHSGSAYILFKIMSLFEGRSNRGLRIASVLPFLVFPSAAFGYAQLHKDSYFIFGNLLFIYVWCLWVQKRNVENTLSLKLFFYYFILWALAYILVWIIRPYWGPIFFFISVLIFIILTLNQIYFLLKEKRAWQKRIIYLALSFTVVLAFGMAMQKKNLPSALKSEVPASEQLSVELKWNPTYWLPVYLDTQLQNMAITRKAFILKYPEAGTNVDSKIIFHSAREMVSYLPRALYIGFFMPTISITFQKGVKPGGTLMRWITGFEMIFIYLCYPFLIMAIWSWRKRLELWIILFWAIGAILLYAMVSPNIGALYRFRYGFLMTLTSIGILRAGILITHRRAAFT